MFTKIFFLFFCFFVFSEDSLGLQSVVRRGSEMFLSQSSRSVYRGFHLPKMFFSDTSLDDQNPPSRVSNKVQVFACPTHDSICKHILCHDESVRLDIFKTFTGITSLYSATQLDEHYNPFDPTLRIRKLINSTKYKNFFEKIRNSSTIDLFLDSKKIDCSFETLKDLLALYEDFSRIFPYHRSRSTIDFQCETDFGYVTIEFQASKQDYWDRIAFAYLSSIYGNKLIHEKDYDHIQDIIGIKNLGDNFSYNWHNQRFIKNYIFVDQNGSGETIPVLRFIYYSLCDANLEHEDLNKNHHLKQWIEFFKSAHEKESIPSSIDEPLRKAYEMIRLDTLKKERPDILKDKSSDENQFFLFLLTHEISKSSRI